MYKSYFKRPMDCFFAIVALLLLSPFFVAIFISLCFANNGKPFFFQARPGKNEKIFKIIKFKTMNDRKDANGNLLPDDVRLTKIGAFVRKTSFDELPQLLNIIKGDMSFVGPRPLLPQYLPLYNEFQRRRHEGRPGMTGWAQINGRNAISWNQKFQYDIEYLENITLYGDFTIFFTTLAKVVKSEGINSDEAVTMAPFTGGEND